MATFMYIALLDYRFRGKDGNMTLTLEPEE